MPMRPDEPTHKSAAWNSVGPCALLFYSILVHTPANTKGWVTLDNIVFPIWPTCGHEAFSRWYTLPSKSYLALLLAHSETSYRCIEKQQLIYVY